MGEADISLIFMAHAYMKVYGGFAKFQHKNVQHLALLHWISYIKDMHKYTFEIKISALLLMERQNTLTKYSSIFWHLRFDVWCTFVRHLIFLHPIFIYVYILCGCNFFANFTRPSHLRIPITQCRLFYSLFLLSLHDIHVKFVITYIDRFVWWMLRLNFACNSRNVIDTWKNKELNSIYVHLWYVQLHRVKNNCSPNLYRHMR